MKSEGPNLDSLSMVDERGVRRYIYPADVSGPNRSAKNVVSTALVIIYLTLPWIDVDGHQSVLLDIEHRQFFLFGATFNSQDFYLVFFILTGGGFGLIIVSALWGRLWCGWACPQTVFLDAIFRRIERLVEGSRHKRMKLARNSGTFEWFWRKGLKHILYLGVCFVLAHYFLAYFVGASRITEFVQGAPGDNPVTFAWVIALTAVFYFVLWWFREQLCITICPYGRLQAALQDDDTKMVVYDSFRGEPRGKMRVSRNGDCVDCRRCIVVCPTGIDIRNGTQLECIGCNYCIDACDEIMGKIGRPKGLVRYDSERGLRGEPTTFWRPRVFFYVGACALGLVVGALLLSNRATFEVNITRPQAVPYSVKEEWITNRIVLHVTNKQPDASTFHFSASDAGDLRVTFPQTQVDLESFADQRVPVLIRARREGFKSGSTVTLVVKSMSSGEEEEVKVRLLGPPGGNVEEGQL